VPRKRPLHMQGAFARHSWDRIFYAGNLMAASWNTIT